MRLAIPIGSRTYILDIGKSPLVFILKEIISTARRLELHWQYGVHSDILQIAENNWAGLPPKNTGLSQLAQVNASYPSSLGNRVYIRFSRESPQTMIFTERYLENHFPSVLEQLESGTVPIVTEKLIHQLRRKKCQIKI